MKRSCEGKIQIIRTAIYGDVQLSENCQRKLIIILLCYNKNIRKCDEILNNLVKKGSNKKKLIFNILLDYSDVFNLDVNFNENILYRELVKFTLENGKYLESLKYRNYDIIQLEILNEKENIEKIYNLRRIITFDKLNDKDYDRAYDEIQKIICYERDKNYKFVYFKKEFWEKFFLHYKMNENEENKIPKLVNLYKLLLSYIDLGKDDSEYKEILAGKIHELILKKLEEIPVAKNQLELLFKKDPYYTSSSYEKNPKEFEKIKILDLKEEQDIEYFTNLNLEKVYSKEFTNYLNVIISKIIGIEDFNSIIKIIKINQEKNREEYINLLIQRYSIFPDEALTEESLINLLEKVLEYTPQNKLKILEEFLPRFGQKNKIYLNVFEIFKTDNGIKE